MARAFAMLLLVTGLGAATAPHAGAAPCAPVDVVIARGTHEPGYLGSVVGDQLYDLLRPALPADSQAYRVNYPADLLDPASISDGTQDMTAHLVRQAAMCPGQRFVLVGYSQGAAVVHGVLGTRVVTALGGIRSLPVELQDRVAAVLLFGDPVRSVGWSVPDLYAGRTGSYCPGGDPICGGGVDPAAHLSYGWALWPAAQFAAARI